MYDLDKDQVNYIVHYMKEHFKLTKEYIKELLSGDYETEQEVKELNLLNGIIKELNKHEKVEEFRS